MNQVESLVEENRELRRALISVILSVGGFISVSDELVASIDLDKDYLLAQTNALTQHHDISVRRQGAPDS